MALPNVPAGRRSAGEPQSQSASRRLPSHQDSLETALDMLGFLPSAEDPVIYRGLGKTGFGLFLYLESGLGPVDI